MGKPETENGSAPAPATDTNKSNGDAAPAKGKRNTPRNKNTKQEPAKEGSQQSQSASAQSGEGSANSQKRKRNQKKRPSTAPADGKAADGKAAPKEGTTLTKEDKEKTSADYYFDSYSHFGIHEEMLKDTVRTNTYRRVLLDNAHLWKDRVILDIGCGTGILSLFAAKAGAKHVYAIECSSIADQAKKIIAANGYSDKITVIQGKVEEIDLPVDKVDVIVSEWMGYFLLYESMLDTVLYARDKWLVPGGMILPDKATMYISALEDGDYKKEKISFWDNVYGFDFSCIKEMALLEPIVDSVDDDNIVSNSFPFMNIDILTVTKEELDFNRTFKIEMGRNDFVHAFLVYFDVGFTQVHRPVYFSTGPHAKYTHWKQTVFYTDDTLVLSKGETVTGSISCHRNEKNPRDLNICVKYKAKGKDCEVDTSQEFRLR